MHALRTQTPDTLRMLTYFCLTPAHAGMFLAFTKNIRNQHLLDEIISKDARWPAKPEERDLLYFLAQSFRAKLLNELPKTKQEMTGEKLTFVFRAKAMLKELSTINFEIAQMTVASDEGETLPDWFMVEVVRDLPRLVQQK